MTNQIIAENLKIAENRTKQMKMIRKQDREEFNLDIQSFIDENLNFVVTEDDTNPNKKFKEFSIKKDGYDYSFSRLLSCHNKNIIYCLTRIFTSHNTERGRCFENGMNKQTCWIEENGVTEYQNYKVKKNTCLLCHTHKNNCNIYEKFSPKAHSKTKAHQEARRNFCDIIEESTGLCFDVVNIIASYL